MNMMFISVKLLFSLCLLVLMLAITLNSGVYFFKSPLPQAEKEPKPKDCLWPYCPNTSKPSYHSLNQTMNEKFLQDLKSKYTPLKVIILAYYRSGSTFLGEMLAQYPGFFYTFEPLSYLHLRSKRVNCTGREKSDTDNVISLFDWEVMEPCGQAQYMIRSLLQCQHRNLGSYTDKVGLSVNTKRLLALYRKRQVDNGLIQELCYTHPFHLMKLVRANLNDIVHYLDVFPELKIIHLIRDPRAILNSRLSALFCMGKEACTNPRTMCAEMENDIEVGRTLPQYRYKLVKHEDLSLRPGETSTAILDFLGLEPKYQITAYINSHTNSMSMVVGKDKTLYLSRVPVAMTVAERRKFQHSTHRISRDVPLAWTRELGWVPRAKVELHCAAIIKNFSYVKPNKEIINTVLNGLF